MCFERISDPDPAFAAMRIRITDPDPDTEFKKTGCVSFIQSVNIYIFNPNPNLILMSTFKTPGETVGA